MGLIEAVGVEERLFEVGSGSGGVVAGEGAGGEAEEADGAGLGVT